MNLPRSGSDLADPTHGGTNAMVAVVLGAYLAIVLYQGNLGQLAQAAQQDFLGTNGARPFWRWAIALLILLALARSQRFGFLFGPLLAFTLVAMLILSAQNGGLTQLNQGIATLFGFPAQATASPAIVTSGVAAQPALTVTPSGGVLPNG